MPLKINFTVPNKAVNFFVVFAVLFSLAGVVAYTYKGTLIDVPNPGHSLTQIQGYSTGDTSLADTIGNKLCQSDGTNCPASSGAEFGGMFVFCCAASGNACAIQNPVTGACSCPAGYTQTTSRMSTYECGGAPCGTQGSIAFCSK